MKKAKAKTAKTAKKSSASKDDVVTLNESIGILTEQLARNTAALDRFSAALVTKASRSPARAAPRPEPEQTTERNPEPAASEQ